MDQRDENQTAQGLGSRDGVLKVSTPNLQFWLGFLLLYGALHCSEEK